MKRALFLVLLHESLTCFGGAQSFRELYADRRKAEIVMNTDDKSFQILTKCFFNNAQYIAFISIANHLQPAGLTDMSTELIDFFHRRVQIPIMTFHELTNAKMYNFNAPSGNRRNIVLISDNAYSLLQYLDRDPFNRTHWHATDNFFITFTATSKTRMYLSEYEMKYRECFQNIWTRYKVLRALVLDNRSSARFWQGSGTDVVTFNPFLKAGTRRGMVQVYSIADADNVCQTLDHFIDDLHGYPISVTMFTSYPYAVPIRSNGMDWNSFDGVDGNALHEAAQFMNFKPIIHRPNDKIKFGYRTEAGTYVGSIGDIVYGKSDVAFNCHYIRNYDDAEIQFVVPPVIYDAIIILVPKSQLIPSWMDLFECMGLTELFSLLGFYVISVCFSIIMRRYSGATINIYETVRIAVSILKMFLTVPIAGTRDLTSFSQRIFASSCLLVGVLIVTGIQVTLVTEISSPNYYPDIDTLEQLAESGLPIATAYQNLVDIFNDSDNPIMTRLAKNVRLEINNYGIKERIAYKMDCAAITTLSNVQHFLHKYVGPSDNPLLHAVHETPRGYFLSYVVPKHSPYVQQINYVTSILIESGLVKKWDADQLWKHQLEVRHNHTSAQRSKLYAYSINDLQTAFFVLVSGLSCGVVAFMAEITVAFKLCPWDKIKQR